MHFFHLENGKELVLAQLKKGVALATVQFFEIENVFVKRDRLLDVVHFDGDMIAAVNFDACPVMDSPGRARIAHFLIYIGPGHIQNSFEMNEFSYLSVLLSVILGLAVAQILKGFRGLLLSRARIRIYWPVIAWAILILLMCFQSWWAMFGMRGRHDWTFPQFTIVLLQTIVTYMLAGLVFPDLFGEEVIDLKESFYAHRGWFFAFGFASIAVSVIKEVILDGRLPLPTNLAFHVVFAATLLVGAVTKREIYHKALVVFGLVLFVVYISLLFVRLQ
jgi:hypothetical protein